MLKNALYKALIPDWSNLLLEDHGNSSNLHRSRGALWEKLPLWFLVSSSIPSSAWEASETGNQPPDIFLVHR